MIVDPAELSLHGHHLTSLKVLASMLPGRTLEAHVNVRSPRGLLEPDARVSYDFEHDPYTIGSLRGEPFRRQVKRRFRQWRARLKGHRPTPIDGSCYVPELAGILSGLSADDHLVAPSASVDMLASLLMCVQGRDLTTLPRLHLRVLELPLAADTRCTGDVHAGWAALSRSSDRVSIYTETETLANHLRVHAGYLQVGRAILQPAPVKVVPQATPGTFRIGYLGGSFRNNKGWAVLGRLIEDSVSEIARRRPDLTPRIVLQVPPKEGLSRRRREALEKLERLAPIVGCVRGSLDMGAFSALVASIDVVMLPYAESRRARLISSGIAIDALLNAVPVVATSLPAIAEFVGDAGIVVDDLAALPRALGDIACDTHAFKERALRNAERLSELVAANDLVSALKQ